MDAISVDRRVNEWRLQSWDLVCGGCASGECHEPAPDLSWGQSAAARLLPLQLQPSGTSQQWQYLLLCGVRIINIYITLTTTLCYWCPSPSLHCYSMIISHHLVHCVVVQQSPSLLPAGHWPNIANKIGEKFWHFTNTCWLGKVGPPELRLLCAQVETWS